MRGSVPIARYSHVCNVLRQWKTSLIPTYRVYRLYDIECMDMAWLPVPSQCQRVGTYVSV